MASINARLPGMNAFDFHALRNMDPHRAAVRLGSIEPASAIRGSLPLDIGRLESDLPNFCVQAVLNAGRIGLPAAELRFQLPALAGGKITELRMAFEPGVHALSAPGGNRYTLNEFSASFQGRSGGAGNTYKHDHPDLREEKDAAKKKRMLKVKLTAHGFVPYPDFFAINVVLNDNRTPPEARDFIRMLLHAKTANMTWYCIFDTGLQTRVHMEILDPFRNIFRQRLPPLYQYEPAKNILTLEMAPYEGFRDSMYCTADRNVSGGFSRPRYQLPDMQGRQAVHTVAKTHIIGHIREFQGQERICREFCSTIQDMRLVKSKYPVLEEVTGTAAQVNSTVALPNDTHMYVGYVNSTSVNSPDHDVPPPGARFQVFWQKKTVESAYGIVLDLSPSALQDKNAAFVVALVKVPRAVKGRAATSVAASMTEKVKLVSVPNSLVAQTQLQALHRYANPSIEPIVVSLQLLSVHRQNISRIPTRDVRGDAVAWGRALVETSAHQLQNQSLPPGANNMLTQLVKNLDGYIELLETPLQGSRIDACLALVWQLLATGSSVVLVSDFVNSRADLSSRIWNMRDLARNAPEFGQMWGNKRLLAYTCSAMSHDGDSVAAIDSRKAIDLSTRYLDDLPSHEWLSDESGTLGQSPRITQRGGGVPSAMSMGKAILSLLSSTHFHPQARQQYFLERQQEIDGTRPASADVGAIISTRNKIELQILRSAHLLVTDSATAASENVRISMQNAVLIYIDTQSVPFSTVASTIASYPKAREVFICGNSVDDRYPLRWYARSQNEARRSTAHGAWNTFIRAGNVPHTLA